MKFFTKWNSLPKKTWIISNCLLRKKGVVWETGGVVEVGGAGGAGEAVGKGGPRKSRWPGTPKGAEDSQIEKWENNHLVVNFVLFLYNLILTCAKKRTTEGPYGLCPDTATKIHVSWYRVT